MAITIKAFGVNSTDSTDDLVKTIRQILTDLEDQLNERAQIYVSTDGRIPAGLNRNDILVIDQKGVIAFLIKNAKGYDTLTAGMIGGLLANQTNFLGTKIAAPAPAISDFPNPNDWGFYSKTSAVIAFYLCFNLNGVLKKVALT